MLAVNPYEQHVCARLLEFFGKTTVWHRALWNVGFVLALKELLEAGEASRQGVLGPENLKYIGTHLLTTWGNDPGVGPAAQRDLIRRCIQSNPEYESSQFLTLRQLVTNIADNYLNRWADTLASGGHLGAERVARSVGAHLLDCGFSPQFLHRWWTYKVKHEAETKSLGELVREASDLAKSPQKAYDILIAFEAMPLGPSGLPANCISAAQVAGLLRAYDFNVSGLRQNGGLRTTVYARDIDSAVEAAAELLSSFAARSSVGTSQHLKSVGRVWILDHKRAFPLERRPRGVQVRALHRENRFYTDTSTGVIDAAVELLEPLNRASPGPAVASGWATIEALLTLPGAPRASAGDHLARLVAVSFPRAELTALAYRLTDSGNLSWESRLSRLSRLSTNRDRAAAVVTAIQTQESLPLADAADRAAVSRMEKLLQQPNQVLNDIAAYVEVAFRRLYRNRNLVLHSGRINAVSLRASLRTAAPLVGAGVDRVVHAQFVNGLTPHEAAVRASIGLALVGTPGTPGPLDLLEQ